MTRRIEGADFLNVTKACCQNDKLLAQTLRPSLVSPFAGRDKSHSCKLSEALQSFSRKRQPERDLRRSSEA
jgi:hypothetical protein